MYRRLCCDVLGFLDIVRTVLCSGGQRHDGAGLLLGLGAVLPVGGGVELRARYPRRGAGTSRSHSHGRRVRDEARRSWIHRRCQVGGKPV